MLFLEGMRSHGEIVTYPNSKTMASGINFKFSVFLKDEHIGWVGCHWADYENFYKVSFIDTRRDEGREQPIERINEDMNFVFYYDHWTESKFNERNAKNFIEGEDKQLLLTATGGNYSNKSKMEKLKELWLNLKTRYKV
jgi:hypothetical protein